MWERSGKELGACLKGSVGSAHLEACSRLRVGAHALVLHREASQDGWGVAPVGVVKQRKRDEQAEEKEGVWRDEAPCLVASVPLRCRGAARIIELAPQMGHECLNPSGAGVRAALEPPAVVCVHEDMVNQSRGLDGGQNTKGTEAGQKRHVLDVIRLPTERRRVSEGKGDTILPGAS